MMPYKSPSWAPKALLGALMLAALAFQTYRVSSLQATVDAQKTTITTLTQRVAADAAQLADRDRLIATQNAGVDALKEAARVNEAVYRERLRAAESMAGAKESRAVQLMNLQTSAEDELGICRAARALLEEELTRDE